MFNGQHVPFDVPAYLHGMGGITQDLWGLVLLQANSWKWWETLGQLQWQQAPVSKQGSTVN